MTEKYRRQLSEDTGCDELELLLEEHAKAEGDALWEAYQEAERSGGLEDFPEELDRKCRRLIRDSGQGQERKSFLRRMGIGAKRAAVFALTLLILASTVIMSVDALRLPVMNFLVVTRERYSALVFGNEIPPEESAEAPLLDRLLKIRPPVKCLLVSQEVYQDGTICLCYKNPDGPKAQLSFSLSDGDFIFDTEDVEETRMQVYGFDAILIKKKGLRLMWYDPNEGGVFDVRAEGISEEEFWKFIYRIME